MTSRRRVPGSTWSGRGDVTSRRPGPPQLQVVREGGPDVTAPGPVPPRLLVVRWTENETGLKVLRRPVLVSGSRL